ncbi:chemotaxis protein CheW [Carboxydothermus hydrogenoformans]|uniref:Chemotaxis protein CheW n=1 Tax=Carboxydothermus hydrogenoformans (strain ATCC BAA-161 / DSM 6008 / Z-2901) TaxID=246194 RepID=Q3ADH1_CARHZ|nr:chemotaxis protein CheW [Carboxydothermus hydrogenoformans]ABB15741.1 chemotaxis protein CheW [Carboxydothermus hydrogenoformans Z-2901]
MAENLTNKSEAQIVIFTLNQQQYGVDIAQVYEIIRMTDITKIPNTPYFVEGVINLRGKIIPVIDLRKRLGMPEAERDKATRIIVVDVDGITVGMIVDSVMEVFRLNDVEIESTPSMINDIDSSFIQGIAIKDERMIILLDLNRVLKGEEKEALANM